MIERKLQINEPLFGKLAAALISELYSGGPGVESARVAWPTNILAGVQKNVNTQYASIVAS
jgi:hypothetical protein